MDEEQKMQMYLVIGELYFSHRMQQDTIESLKKANARLENAFSEEMKSKVTILPDERAGEDEDEQQT